MKMCRIIGISRSALADSIKRQAKRFAGDRSANVAVVTAVMLVALILCAGAAVDYARAYQVKTHLAGALDAAVISVARDLRDGRIKKADAKARAQAFFDLNTKTITADDAQVDQLTIRYQENDTEIYVAASASVPTVFMRLGGIDVVPLALKAEVTYSFDIRQVEIAMVLDVTGSMGNNGRIDALRDAATDLVESLIPDESKNEKVRIAIVPYSQGVNAGTYAETVTGGASTSCATERIGGEQFTDASYTAEAIGNGSTGCPSNRIRPLIKNKTTLIDHIQNLTTGGYTAGHTGIAWGWYTLSPNWTDVWPTNSAPEPYPDSEDDELMKVAVIMTDGEFNTAYVSGSSGSGLTEKKGTANYEAETRARALCNQIKAQKIRVYSVAFQAGSSAEALLRDCATSEATYFKAENAGELRNAFKGIASDIGTFWLSK